MGCKGEMTPTFTKDLLSEVCLNLAWDLVASCCGHQAACWRPAWCWLWWVSMSIGNPNKSHYGGSGVLTLQTFYLELAHVLKAIFCALSSMLLIRIAIFCRKIFSFFAIKFNARRWWWWWWCASIYVESLNEIKPDNLLVTTRMRWMMKSLRKQNTFFANKHIRNCCSTPRGFLQTKILGIVVGDQTGWSWQWWLWQWWRY